MSARTRAAKKEEEGGERAALDRMNEAESVVRAAAMSQQEEAASTVAGLERAEAHNARGGCVQGGRGGGRAPRATIERLQVEAQALRAETAAR